MVNQTKIGHLLDLFEGNPLLEMSGVHNDIIYVGVTLDYGRNWYNIEYFKVYNSPSFSKATKVARIKFREPEYIHHKGSKKNWNLNVSERKDLVEFLESKSTNFKDYTVWQECIMYFNLQVYNIPYPESQVLCSADTEDPNNKYYRALPIDLEIPDYVKGIA